MLALAISRNRFMHSNSRMGLHFGTRVFTNTLHLGGSGRVRNTGSLSFQCNIVARDEEV